MSSTSTELDLKTRRLVVALNDARLEVTKTTASATLTQLATTADAAGYSDLGLRLSTARNQFEEGSIDFVSLVQVLRTASVMILQAATR